VRFIGITTWQGGFPGLDLALPPGNSIRADFDPSRKPTLSFETTDVLSRVGNLGIEIRPSEQKITGRTGVLGHVEDSTYVQGGASR
jgi:hypothetical protein